MVGQTFTGRTHSWLSVDNLRKSEVIVLETLLNWNYSSFKASVLAIAQKTQLSQSAVYYALIYLKSRGIISKSVKGSWFIIENLKTMFLQEITKEKEDIKANTDQTSLISVQDQ